MRFIFIDLGVLKLKKRLKSPAMRPITLFVKAFQ